MKFAHYLQVALGVISAGSMAYAPYASPAVSQVLHGIAAASMAAQVPIGLLSVSVSPAANANAVVQHEENQVDQKIDAVARAAKSIAPLGGAS